MNKYVPLKTVLNFIPSSIQEEWSEGQLLSWAFQGYKQAIKNPDIVYDYRVCLSEITDHTGSLPNEVVKVAEVGYSLVEPSKILDDEIVQQNFIMDHPNFLDDDDRRLLVFQQLIYGVVDKVYDRPIYKGQNPELLTNDCVNIHAPTCALGFSLDKSLSTITLDCKTGWVFVLYTCPIKDNEGDMLIPDNPELMLGLSFYAEAMNWRERYARKEEQAYNMFEQSFAKYHEKVDNAKVTFLKERFSIRSFNNLIFNRFPIQKHPYVSGKNRNFGILGE